MKIELQIHKESPILNAITKEIIEENKNLRKKLEMLEKKAKERGKIKIRLKKPPSKKTNYIVSKFSGSTIKIYKTKPRKKEEIKTGLISIGKNIDEIIEKKVNEILNEKSKIKLMVRPKIVKKNIVIKRVEEPPKIYEKKEPIKKEHEKIRVFIKKESTKKPEHIESSVEKIIRMGPGVTLKLKPSEKKQEKIKTGYISQPQTLDMLSVLKDLLKPKEKEERPPEIKGIEIPEV